MSEVQSKANRREWGSVGHILFNDFCKFYFLLNFYTINALRILLCLGLEKRGTKMGALGKCKKRNVHIFISPNLLHQVVQVQIDCFTCYLHCCDTIFSKEVIDLVTYDNKSHPSLNK